jgi:anionic cell wall polymer biosynthesis LytR-Cps2A-Psr (LCP) family protein
MTQREKKKKSAGRLIAILFAELLVLLILFAVFKVYTSLNKINRNDTQDSLIVKNPEVVADKGYRNIVIFGVDSRENSLTEGTHSDTIIIASLNKETKGVKIASVYRDTYANIPDVGYKKINASYFDGGYSLALSTINKNSA